MNSEDAKTLRADLDVMLDATGLGDQPTRTDMIGWIAVFLGGAASVAFALVPHGLFARWGSLSLVLPLFVLGAQYFHGTPSTRDKKRGKQTVVAVVLAVAIASIYRIWANALGLDRVVATSVFLFCVGSGLLLGAIGQHRRPDRLLFPVLLLAGGLALPLGQTPQLTVSLMFAVAGGLGALYCRSRLAQSKSVR